jgi:hypothetical protein
MRLERPKNVLDNHRAMCLVSAMPIPPPLAAPTWRPGFHRGGPAAAPGVRPPMTVPQIAAVLGLPTRAAGGLAGRPVDRLRARLQWRVALQLDQAVDIACQALGLPPRDQLVPGLVPLLMVFVLVLVLRGKQGVLLTLIRRQQAERSRAMRPTAMRPTATRASTASPRSHAGTYEREPEPEPASHAPEPIQTKTCLQTRPIPARVPARDALPLARHHAPRDAQADRPRRPPKSSTAQLAAAPKHAHFISISKCFCTSRRCEEQQRRGTTAMTALNL